MMWSAISGLIPYLVRYRWRYAWGLAALALKVVATVAIPFATGFAIDSMASPGANAAVLAPYALAIVGLACIRSGCNHTSRVLLLGASREIEHDLRNDLTAHLLGLPRAFYEQYRTGDLMSRAVHDLSSLQNGLGRGFVYAAELLATVGAILAVMSVSDWRLTCLVFLPVAITSVTLNLFARRIHDQNLRVQERFGDMTGMVSETLRNIRIVRAYSTGSAESRRFERLNDALGEENLALTRLWQRMYPRLEVLIGLTSAVALGFGGWQVVEANMSVGDFAMFIAYVAMLAWPIIGFGTTLNIVERGAAAVLRLDDIFRAPITVVDGPKTDRSITEIRGDIEFKNVSVMRPGSKTPALDSVDLYVPAGEIVAVVGSVGSGKSTLANLAARLIDPSEGMVLVDGSDLKTAPIATLRASLAVVEQQSFLFGRTIFENLLLGAPQVTEWQVAEACELAQLTQDLEKLEDGLATVVGERGVTLSGGQKQRVALARAVLRDPRILILDDATSHIDALTEARVIERLSTFMRNRTTLIITHRMTAAQIADKIVVLEGGHIVERGTHDELLDLEGVYYSICRRQMLEEELVRDE